MARDRQLVQVKIGTLPGDVMWLLHKRKWPKVGDKITLRHVGPGSHGTWDMVVKVTKIANNRIYGARWAQAQTRSYGNERISIDQFKLWIPTTQTDALAIPDSSSAAQATVGEALSKRLALADLEDESGPVLCGPNSELMEPPTGDPEEIQREANRILDELGIEKQGDTP